MSPSCVFCSDVAGAGEVLAEDMWSWTVRHPQGQVMVVAKRHVQNVSDLDEEEWLRVARAWHRAERTLREESGADRVIILKLGVQTPHLHIHLHPFSSESTREEIFLTLAGR